MKFSQVNIKYVYCFALLLIVIYILFSFSVIKTTSVTEEPDYSKIFENIKHRTQQFKSTCEKTCYHDQKVCTEFCLKCRKTFPQSSGFPLYPCVNTKNISKKFDYSANNNMEYNYYPV